MENVSSDFEEQVIASANKLSLKVFSCGSLRVDASQNRLYLAQKEPLLQPKVMQLLLFLCAADGKTLTKQQLTQMLWPDTQVGPDSLANTMTRLRRALSDSSKEPQYIETVQRKGYRWLLSVEQTEVTSTNKLSRYFAVAALLITIVGLSYWLTQSEPEEFPFTDLSIETTDKGMEVKVGIEAEVNQTQPSQVQQDKIKQEISRITGKDPKQMKITIDRDCTPLEIENKQTKHCYLAKKQDEDKKPVF